MNISGNMTFFVGLQTNQRVADTPQAEQQSKQLNRGSVFVGNLNDNLFFDRIEEKKKQAQKKAMQVIGDAWESDCKIWDDLQERRDLIAGLEEENQAARKEINEITKLQEEAKLQYGITDDCKEQQDLELLRKKRNMFTDPQSNESLTMDELRYVWKLEAKGLTDYQQKQLDLDEAKKHWQDIIDANQKIIMEENTIIRHVRLEKLKNDPMVKAQKEAETILDSSGKEIVGILVEKSKERIDAESEKKQEEAEKLEEKQEQLEETIEAQKEKRSEAEEFFEEMPIEELIDMGRLKDEVKQEIQNIVNEMKLAVEDIKGAMVDESL